MRAPTSILIISALLSASFPTLSFAQIAEKGAATTIAAEFVVNGDKLGDEVFQVSPDDRILLPVVALHHALDGRAKPGLIGTLTASGEPANAETLATQGISLDFDRKALVVSLDIPGEAMVPMVLGGAAGTSTPSGVLQKPEDFPAMLGLGWRTGLSLADPSKPQATQVKLEMDLDPAINLFGLVAEGSFVAAWNTVPSFDLLNARLVRDFPAVGVRATAGTGFMNDSSFGGSFEAVSISVGSEASMQTSIAGSAHPVGEIVVNRRARVSAEINGVVVRRYTIGRGTWRLADLPLATGINGMTLRIEEEGSEPRVINLSLPFDPGIHDPGSFDFWASAGVDRATLSEPAGSFGLTLGLVPALEAGLRGAFGFGSLVGEASTTWASPLGTMAASAALARSADGSYRAAGRYSWFLSLPALPLFPHLSAAGEYRAAGFAGPATIAAGQAVSDTDSFTVSGQISQTFPRGSGSLSLSGDVGLESGIVHSGSVSSSLQLPVARATILTASIGTLWHSGLSPIPRASLVLAVIPGNSASMLYHYDLMNRSDSFDLTLGKDPATQPVVALRAEGLANEITRGAGGSGLGIGAHSTMPLFDLAGQFDHGYSGPDSPTTNSLSASATTALAWAGGHLGMRNSIGSAFAVLVPEDSIGLSTVVMTTMSG
ncbi:MAG: hypothetical protein WCL50_11050, partial [Spirochaetota bacterium]